jgi:putative ABC transport system substrate-binding protein
MKSLRLPRREFLTLLGGAMATAAWPLVARAQQPKRVGVLMGYAEKDSAGQSLIAAFRTTLRQIGWVEDRDLQIEVRWGDAANPERMRAGAQELVAAKPDAIVVHGQRTLAAVTRETRTIPVIFASLADPVGAGAVKSLAQPGGNVTGFSVFGSSSIPKLLEALKEIAPRIARAALVVSPDNIGLDRDLRALEEGVRLYDMSSTAVRVRSAVEIESAFAKLASENNCGLVVSADVVFSAQPDLIVAAAARHRLPAAYVERSFTEAGGLMSYGINREDQYRRVAVYIDRILKGAKPAELPVQLPTKFEFVLNLKAAKALGLAVPTALLLRADEVIE